MANKDDDSLTDSLIDQLALACTKGDIDGMKSAIAAGADPNNDLTTVEGQTALECVLYCCALAVARANAVSFSVWQGMFLKWARGVRPNCEHCPVRKGCGGCRQPGVSSATLSPNRGRAASASHLIINPP